MGTKFILKRDGSKVQFERSKVERVFGLALGDSNGERIEWGNYEKLIDDVCESVEDGMTVEDVSDLLQRAMMRHQLFDTAEKFISYRGERSRERKSGKKSKFFSNEFLSKYKHAKEPFNPLGSFVYYRTYSSWLPELNRRETWFESVKRMVEFNCSLAPTSIEEAEKLFHNVFYLKQNLSGRMAFIGGKPTSYEHPLSLFNCAYITCDDMKVFNELFYMLMLGAGVGFKVTKDEVIKLPKVRQGIRLVNKHRNPKKPNDRNEYTTTVHTSKNTLEIIIGDSREGFKDAIDIYFKVLYDVSYRDIETVLINYDNIREEGERLKRFGGKSGGSEPLVKMFDKIHGVTQKLDSGKYKLKPIDCLDIANIIGENVVAGNIRRTAEIIIFSPDDEEVMNAKNELYTQENGEWKVNQKIIHRAMSNNTVVFEEKPSKETLHEIFERMKISAEPAFYNIKEARRRNPYAQGLNPCGEIILDSRQCCNLTNLNMLAFVREDDTYDLEGMLEAQALSTRAGYRVTCLELELPEWNMKQKRDRLLGVSLSGIWDFINATKINQKDLEELFRNLRDVAVKSANDYADKLGMNHSLLVTTIKPSGSSSQLYGESAGAHANHSPYFKRRVRISTTDPLLKVVEELGYHTEPEVGQTIDNCTTKVVEFYVKAPEGKTKYEIGAIEQLEMYKTIMKNYVQHNCSITVHVRPEEWELCEQWVYDNWDDNFVAVSFIPLDDSFYQLLPYEAITKEEYIELSKNVKPFNPELIKKYERAEIELEDITDESCSSGVCAIR